MPLLAQLVELAADTYDPAVARRAGGRARFDHLACRTQGLRDAPAALGNAGAAVLADMDDLHWRSVTHPGAIVWAALDAVGAGGDQLWRAAHMAYEVTTRLGLAFGTEHRRYWHATTTAGTVGAAVGAALVIEADPVVAAAHAISVVGGLDPVQAWWSCQHAVAVILLGRDLATTRSTTLTSRDCATVFTSRSDRPPGSRSGAARSSGTTRPS